MLSCPIIGVFLPISPFILPYESAALGIMSSFGLFKLYSFFFLYYVPPCSIKIHLSLNLCFLLLEVARCVYAYSLIRDLSVPF